MKNKIITLICIMAIMITTVIVTFANQGTAKYTRDTEDTPTEGTLIVQNLNGVSFPTSRENLQLYPGGTIDREVTVTNVSNDVNTTNNAGVPVFLRTVFAFEANGFESLDEFHSSMCILLNQQSDNNEYYWNWLANDQWQLIEIDDQKYYMAVTTYGTALKPGATTEPSLLKVGLHSGVTSEIVNNFGDGYEMRIVTQAVQADGWKYDNNAVTVISGILDTAFGTITSTSHPWTTDGSQDTITNN